MQNATFARVLFTAVSRMVRISWTISPFKSFRHFAATFLVDAGAPIEIIKDFMGHQNISTTMIYAKIKTDTLKKVGLAFEQSRVSTKCPQEGNGVKLST